MTLNRTILAAVFGCAALALGPVQAAEREHHQESKEAISAFDKASLSLNDAVAAAEKQTGGKAIDAAFNAKGGKLSYEIKTFANDSITEVNVDAQSGAVSTGKVKPVASLDKEDKAEIAAFQQSQVSLQQAALAAERQAGGKAMDVGLESEKGQVSYEAQVLKDGAIKKVMVDPANGATK
jgi:uncharacterized membrane protein YkoI